MKLILFMRSFAESSFALAGLDESQISMIKGIITHDKIYTMKKKTFFSMLKTTLKKSGIRYSMYHMLSNFLYKKTYFKNLQNIYDTKYFANKGIPIFHTTYKTEDELAQWIINISPDLMVSLYYDQKITNTIATIPHFGTINVHPSLLPKYRGANPNFWVLLNEEKYAGTTLHLISEKLDAGDIVAQQEFLVNDKDDLFSLDMKCAISGGNLLKDFLYQLINTKTCKAIKQDDLLTSKAGIPVKNNLKNFYAKKKALFSIKAHLCKN